MTYTPPYVAQAGSLIRASDHNLYFGENIAHLYDNLPTRATMWHDEATVISGQRADATGGINSHAIIQRCQLPERRCERRHVHAQVPSWARGRTH